MNYSQVITEVIDSSCVCVLDIYCIFQMGVKLVLLLPKPLALLYFTLSHRPYTKFVRSEISYHVDCCRGIFGWHMVNFVQGEFT